MIALGLRVAIDCYIGEEGEELRGAVAAAFELKELRRGIDERGRRLAGAEGVVEDDVFQERDVRLYAADAELAQRPVHALEGDGE